MSNRGDEPAIRELAVESDDDHVERGPGMSQPARVPLVVVVIVVVAAIAGLSYGFLLGRGNQPADDPLEEAATTTTTPRPTTTVPTTPTLPETRVTFVRSPPGRDLGAGVTEYLDPNRYTTLLAAADGSVWAGGETGVVRLDPMTGEMRWLTGPDGTGPVNVRFLSEEPDGAMWAATDNSLVRWHDGAWTDEARFPEAERRWVQAMEIGDDGTMWLATLADDRSPDASEIHHARTPFIGDIPTTSLGDYIGSIESGPDGRIWALTSRALWEFDGTWREVLEPGPRWFNAMAVDIAGEVWFGSESRLFYWDGTDLTERFWGGPPADPRDPLESEMFVSDLASAPDAGIWALVLQAGEFGLATSQIVQVGAGPAEPVDVPSQFEPWAHGLAVTANGDVWLAGSTSLLRYNNGEWTEYRLEDGPPIGSMGSIAAGPSGDVWTVDSDGIIHRHGDGWTLYEHSDFGRDPVDYPAGRSQDFWVTTGPNGEVWGGIGCRAYRFADGQWIPLPTIPGETELCWEMTVAAAPDGSLWMSPGCCANRPPVYHLGGDEWQVFEPPLGEVSDLAVTADGEIWLASFSGTAHFNGTEWSTPTAGREFASIAVAGDGRIWAAASRWSQRPGLWLFDGGR